MPESTVLLLSTDSCLTDSCQQEARSIAHLRMVVVDGIEAAEAYLRDGAVSLLLVHLTRKEQTAEVLRLLKALAGLKRSVATLVIGEQHLAEQGLTLLRQGATDYLTRPLDLGRLAYLMDSLTLRARYAVGPAAPATVAEGEVGMRAPSRVELLCGPEPAAVGGGEPGPVPARFRRLPGGAGRLAVRPAPPWRGAAVPRGQPDGAGSCRGRRCPLLRGGVTSLIPGRRDVRRFRP